MLPWYVWMLAGLALLIIELMTGTMYLLWAACGAFLASMVSVFLHPVWWVPWLVFSASAFLLVALTRPLAKRVQNLPTPHSNVDGLVGKRGVVLQRIDAAQNTGRVRVDSDEWRARCATVVEEGAQVVVEGVEGTTLVVTPADH